MRERASKVSVAQWVGNKEAITRITIAKSAAAHTCVLSTLTERDGPFICSPIGNATSGSSSRACEERQELDAFNPQDTNIDALARLASTLTEAFLINAGFHQHKRQWRKRKGKA